jgi:hypothetical protein
MLSYLNQARAPAKVANRASKCGCVCGWYLKMARGASIYAPVRRTLRSLASSGPHGLDPQPASVPRGHRTQCEQLDHPHRTRPR